MTNLKSIGIVWPGPADPEDIEETEQFLPSDVKVHMVGPNHQGDSNSPGGITLEKLLLMPEDPFIEQAATELIPFAVTAAGYGCTSASYIRGVGGDVDISERITAATGLPATTTSSAAVVALRHLGVRRVSVLSPHIDELNERLDRFLVDSGFEVVHMRGLNKLGGIENIPQNDIRDLVLELVNRPDADGVFISCTGMRTSSIIDPLEKAIGKPVVSAMQATVWETLKIGGLLNEVAGKGSLYREAVTA